MNKIFCCNEVMDRLLGLFDQRETYIQRLIALGFDDFLPWISRFERFSASPEELVFSKKTRMESDRRMFWNGCMLSAGWFFNQEPRPPFEGDWLDQLVLEKGVKVVGDLDPCYQREEQWLHDDYKNWRFLMIEMREQQLKRRTEMVLTGVVPKCHVNDSCNDIKDFVAAQMLQHLGDSGFRRIKKGNKRYSVLAKKLDDFLEIRLVMDCHKASFSEFPSMFCGPDKELDWRPNMVDLELTVHQKSARQSPMSDTPSFSIFFLDLVPLHVYGLYRNSDHLAVAIGGWANLYKMVGNEIESACVEGNRNQRGQAQLTPPTQPTTTPTDHPQQ